MNVETAKTCVGRLARIRLPAPAGRGLLVYGRVVDFPAGQPMTPRRIRIEHGEPQFHGDVVQPHEYKFEGWADQEED
jgi:hypothetical protein